RAGQRGQISLRHLLQDEHRSVAPRPGVAVSMSISSSVIRRSLWLIILCPLLAPAASPDGANTGPIPLEDFFRPPQLSSATLSPDGRLLAALTAEENESGHLLFMDTDTKKIV